MGLLPEDVCAPRDRRDIINLYLWPPTSAINNSDYMEGPHALDLPEIRLVLAEHLDRKLLLSCVLVNRSWRVSFTPALWKQVERKKTPTWTAGVTCLSKEVIGAITRNSRHIRYLSTFLVGFADFEAFKTCVQLRRLEYGDTLKEIKIDIPGGILDGDLWRTLEEACLSVDNLSIGEGTIFPSDFPSFWNVSGRLVSLDLSGTLLPGRRHALDTGGSEPLPLLERLKTLRLSVKTTSTKVLLRIVEHCPNIETLALQNMEDYEDYEDSEADDDVDEEYEDGMEAYQPFPVQGFTRSVSAGAWKQLNSLDTLCCSLDDPKMSTILKAVPVGLKILKLYIRDFGAHASDALLRHSSTLEEADVTIKEGDGFDHNMTLKLLIACPRLEVLIGGNFNLDKLGTVPSPKPWVCKGMRRMQVHVIDRGMAHGQEQLKRAVLQQFASLEKLTHLSVLGFPVMRLDRDLAALASLRRLNTVEFGDISNLGKDDVEWMLEHWPKLERVTGKLNSNYQIDIDLLVLLRTRGVKYEQIGPFRVHW